jgi:hypothetical protein
VLIDQSIIDNPIQLFRRFRAFVRPPGPTAGRLVQRPEQRGNLAGLKVEQLEGNYVDISDDALRLDHSIIDDFGRIEEPLRASAIREVIPGDLMRSIPPVPQ